jgi:hypothetical protein
MVVAAGDALAWNAPRTTFHVVRPDGCIAFRCDANPGQLSDVGQLTVWLIDNVAGSLTAE